MPPVVPFSTNVGTFIDQTTKPRVLSPLAWAITVGTSSTEIVAENMSRRGLLISNPGAVNILVCPSVDGNGNPLSAGGAGSLTLVSGQWLYFGVESQCTAGWNAAAASVGSNPVTVWEFY